MLQCSFWREEALSWKSFQKKDCLFSLLLIALCLMSIFNMVTEACRVCDVSLGCFAVSLHICCDIHYWEKLWHYRSTHKLYKIMLLLKCSHLLVMSTALTRDHNGKHVSIQLRIKWIESNIRMHMVH